MKTINLKKIFKLVFLLLLVIIASTRVLASDGVNGTTNKRIITYYGDWVHYGGQDFFNPADMPLDKVSHVNYAFVDVFEDGGLGFMDTYAAFDKTFGEAWDSEYKGIIGQFQKLRKQYPNTRFGFSLGGWSRSAYFPTVAADPVKRAKLVKESVDLVQKYGFDFVDIDWEYPDNQYHFGYTGIAKASDNNRRSCLKVQPLFMRNCLNSNPIIPNLYIIDHAI